MIYDIMWQKMKNFWNRMWNTLMIAPRTVGAGLHAVTKVVDTTTNFIKNALDVGRNTLHKTRDVLIDPWTHWKRYQKAWNIALSPIIATWTLFEWTWRTIVTPISDLVSDSTNTIDSTIRDTQRSIFGRLFSKKPVSDFSYDNFKTADVINKDNNRFSWLQFGKKKWVWTDSSSSKESSKKTEKVDTVATAATATAVAAWTDKIKELKESFDKKLEEMKKWFSDKINELFEKNKELENKNMTLENENKGLKQANDGLAKQLEAQTKQNQELQKAMASLKDAKPADKPVEQKLENKEEKKEEKPTVANVDKKPEEKKPAVEKADKKPEEKKPTAEKESNKPEPKKEWEKVLDSDRFFKSINLPKRAEPMVSYRKLKHPDMEYRLYENHSNWHIHVDKDSKYMELWTANSEQFNTEMLHECYHGTIHDKVPWTEELVNRMQTLNKKYWKPLFTVSNNEMYDTQGKRAIEDACEWAALFTLSAQDFDKHMENLQRWTDEHLAKINKLEAEDIKNLCEKILSNLDAISKKPVAKTIKMFPDNDADITYSAAA